MRPLRDHAGFSTGARAGGAAIGLLLGLLLVASCRSGCIGDPPPPPPDDPASGRCEVTGRPWTTCPALHEPAPAAEGEEPLVPGALCEDEVAPQRPPERIPCPAPHEVVWIVDDDKDRRGRQPWAWLLGATPNWRVACQGGDGGPLAAQWPGGFESIQHMTRPGAYGPPSAPSIGSRNSIRLPGLRPEEEVETHAIAALERLRGWMHDRGGPGTRLAFFAFDGIPDGDPATARGDGRPVDRFRAVVESLARFVGQGDGLFVIAAPELYEFVYVIARRDAIAYARAILPQVAQQLQARAGGRMRHAPVLLDLSPQRTPALRNRVAAFAPRVELGTPFGATTPQADPRGLRTLARRGAGWSEDQAWRTGARDRTLNVQAWLHGDDADAVTLDVSWRAPPSTPPTAGEGERAVVSPFVLPAPRVVTTLRHGLRSWRRAEPQGLPPLDSFEGVGADVLGGWGLRRLDVLGERECPALLNAATCDRCEGGPQSLYAVAAFEPRRLHMTLVRSPSGGGGIPSRGLGLGEEDEAPALARQAREIQRTLAAPGDARLPVVVLVSPRLTVESCVEGMSRVLSRENVWHTSPRIGVGRGDAGATVVIEGCDDSPLRELAVATRDSPQGRFRINDLGDGQSHIDPRAGVSVLLRVIERVTATPPEGGEACVLARLQVQYECLGALNARPAGSGSAHAADAAR